MSIGSYSTTVVTSPEVQAALRDLPADLPGGLPVVPAGTSGLSTTGGRYGLRYEHNIAWGNQSARSTLVRKMLRTSSPIASGWRFLRSLLTGGEMVIRRPKGVSEIAADASEMWLGLGTWADDGGRCGYSPDGLVSEMSSAFPYGNVALSEAWTYDEGAGLYFPSLHRRQQASYDAYITDEAERLLAIRQVSYGGDVYRPSASLLPLGETLWLVHDEGEGGFDGVSLLRPIYGRWRSSEMRWRQEDAAAHRFAVGMYQATLDEGRFLEACGTAGDDRTPAQLITAEVADMKTRLETLDNYKGGHLIHPSWWTVVKLGGSGDQGFDPTPLLASGGAHERAISEGLYTAWLTQGRQGDGGSRSMVETQSGAVERVAVDYMQAITGALNRQTLRRFLDVNFSTLPAKEQPSVGFEGIRPPAWMASPGVFADFVQAGIVTVDAEVERAARADAEVERAARAQLDLPAPEEEPPSAFDRTAAQAGGRLRTERGQREARAPGASRPTMNKLVERPGGAG